MNEVDKSGCGGKTKGRGGKKGKWKWGDGVEIKAKGRWEGWREHRGHAGRRLEKRLEKERVESEKLKESAMHSSKCLKHFL